MLFSLQMLLTFKLMSCHVQVTDSALDLVEVGGTASFLIQEVLSIGIQIPLAF